MSQKQPNIKDPFKAKAITEKDCGGAVVEMISIMLTKMVEHSVPLSERELDCIKAAMSIAAAENAAHHMRSNGCHIPVQYAVPPNPILKDEAGVVFVPDYFRHVWRDTVNKVDLVLVNGGRLMSSMELWVYIATPLHNYLNREPTPELVFTLVEFHGALNSNGTERFIKSGMMVPGR